jgi:predicted permease
MLEQLRDDLRAAGRGLRRSPLTFAAAVFSIAIGIGALAMVYSWLDNLVLRPLPAVPDPDRLVAFNWAPVDGEVGGVPLFSYPALRGWREAVHSLESMAAEGVMRFSVRREAAAAAEPAWGLLTTANYFEVVGVHPMLGRAFLAEEESSPSPVAVVSEPFWRRYLDGDSAAIGRTLVVNGTNLTVVGVAAPRFVGVIAGLGFDLWIPLAMQPQLVTTGSALEDRSQRWLRGVARLRPGATVAEANRELALVARAQSAEAGERPITSASVQRFRDQQLGSLLLPLLGATLVMTGVVLMLACANVANLLLMRAVGRRREMAVRLALGAPRRRLARQLFYESLVLGLAGGALGVAVAGAAKGLFGVFIPPVPEPVAYTLALNPRVLGLAAVVALITAFLFGTVPALEGSRPDQMTALRTADALGRRGGRLRAVLAVSQLVFSMVALFSAGLFLRSLSRARAVDLGIGDPTRLLLVSSDLAQLRHDSAETAAIVDRVLDQFRALPGASSASATTSVPLGFGGHARVPVRIEGYVFGADERNDVERVTVSPGYFEAMGVPIVAGRPIDDRDRATTGRVAVVNEAFVRRYWPGLEPLGRRVEQGPGWATVVGVARDGRYDSPGDPPYPLIYTAWRQWPAASITFLLRTQADPRASIEPARRAAVAVSADLPFLDPRTMAEHMEASTFVQRLGGSVLGTLGVIALVMAALGLYAVVGQGVAERRREIGIRIALGQTRVAVLAGVVGRSGRLVAIGIVVGTGAAIGLGQLFRSQLIGVSPADPVVLGAIVALLSATALMASWVPARRASRLDPAETLRVE